MDGIFCLLNKQCRTKKSKELVDNLQAEQEAVEGIYSTVNTIDSTKKED